MAEIDPPQAVRPSPLTIDKRLRERVTQAVIAQAGIRHEGLNAFLKDRLAGTDIVNGALFSELVIEGAAGYVSSEKTPAELRGAMLHARLVDALTAGSAGDDYRFDYPAYAHQLEAWRILTSAERRSLLVSSGTGSGKTECFLIPLLDDLAREAEERGRLTGVRALMLYPLNALIASQEERLRRWIAPFGGDIRFALYNGLMQDKRKYERDRAETEVPEQVLYRQTLRKDPPPVLVTNNTMLEYMTIRKEDHPIVEASKGMLRWIIIDEAHSYIGSAAAEVSLLLRRVLQTFEVDARNVRFVATSATIGGTDESARNDLQRYLADLAGVPVSQVDVVFGSREQVTLPPVSQQSALSVNDLARRDRLAANSSVQTLIRDVERQPVSMRQVAAISTATGCDTEQLIEAIASRAASGDTSPLLPIRVHKFVRAVPGLWSCINPACHGGKPDGWPFGSIHFEMLEQCGHCSAPVFEIISCRECGEPWLSVFDHGDSLKAAASPPDRDEFAAASARETDEVAEDGDDASIVDAPTSAAAVGIRRLIGSRAIKGLAQAAVDPTTGALLESREEGSPFWLSKSAEDGSCPRCHAAPSKNSASPLWPFRFGAPSLIQNATPTMLEGVAPSPRRNIELPAEGRQLLSFTDSRQGTARFAANVETMSERSYVRAFVYHLAQRSIVSSPLDPEERSKLEAQLSKLRPLASTDETFASMAAEVEAKLSGAAHANASVKWGDAVRELSKEPMVDQWIRAVWEERDERYKQDREAFGRFLLLRELARRPRRANAIETLGLAKLVFAEIDAVSASKLPPLLKRKGKTVTDWRDFLYYLIDTSVRGYFVLNISRNDARWLLPRNAFLRNIVGPGQEKRSDFDASWPKAREVGPKASAVLLLERALELDSSSAEDRAEINDLLATAWAQLSPLLQGAGSTYALDFERAAIAPVRNAWLCPVTHRVLPRLVFGRTPYGIRGSAPGAADVPTQLIFPKPPTTFPRAASERELVASWLAEDMEISVLRKMGVWGDIHDRAATFAPYVRAEEHSAQQPPHRLRAFEAEFKAGEINLLACSTTMEMGVDIGSVEAVLNTNVPPSIANYRQRVGRAGRRSQSFSSSLTFARNTPLDREAFSDPVSYLTRSLRSPSVKLDSKRIVQRHVNAFALATWVRAAEGQLIRIKAGDFFGFPQGLGLDPEQNPPVARFCEWLAKPSTFALLESGLKALLAGTALQHDSTVLSITEQMFKAATAAFARQWAALRDQAKLVAPEARTSIEMQLKRMCREPLLKELSTRSLLPGHGFPTAVVPFINDCAETRDRQRNRQDDEGETSRNRRYDYPSRNADIAIREYAPGAEVVIDGLVWTSAGVTLNWQRPAHDEAAREIQSIKFSWQCRDCGESDCAQSQETQCSACGSTSLTITQFLEPAGFRVDWASSPHAETDRVAYIEPETARISARSARWEPLLDPALGRGRATSDGLVFYHSRGAGKEGYRVCLDCGRTAEEGVQALSDHTALVPARGSGGRCSGNDKTYAITRPLALGHEVLTDVCELQPAALADAGAAWALASAIREALSRRLGIEARELGLGVEQRLGPISEKTHSLFFYDQSSGGAGYAPRLLDDLTAVLIEAARVLDCPVACQKGCSACVLVSDLYAEQEIIDRKAAHDFLATLLAGMAEPQPEDVAMPGSVLSPPVADMLARNAEPGDVVTIYCGHEPNLAELAQPVLASLFQTLKKANVEVRVVLDDGFLNTLDDAARAGLRNASHRQAFTLWTGPQTTASNGAVLLASHQRAPHLKGYFSRDPGASTLGAQWGVGSQHPVVTNDHIAPAAIAPIPEEALERALKTGDRVRIITSDPGRPIKQFGSGFVTRVLQEDLEAAGLWKPGRLIGLSYADRYLKAPLPVVLMLRVAAGLRDRLGSEHAALPLTITTEPLKPDRYGGAPNRLFNNWQSENDRAETIEALAERLGFACEYDNRHAPHGRKMTLRYDDGTQAVLLFDQGFGYWKASNGDRHDFRAGPGQQAKALLDAHALVAGHGESYVAITSS